MRHVTEQASGCRIAFGDDCELCGDEPASRVHASKFGPDVKLGAACSKTLEDKARNAVSTNRPRELLVKALKDRPDGRPPERKLTWREMASLMVKWGYTFDAVFDLMVFALRRGKCHYCQQPMNLAQKLHIDEANPAENGTDPHNWKPLIPNSSVHFVHAGCNWSHGSRDALLYLASLRHTKPPEPTLFEVG